MTAFDYCVVGVVAASLMLGMWRGVVGEIIALAAWVLAFLAARAWGTELAPLLTAFAEPALRLAAAWGAVFLVVLVAMALLRLALRGLLKALGMTLTDRLLGVIFGAARGMIIVLALVMVGGMTALPKEKWWNEAYLAAPLQPAVLASRPWLPADVAKRIKFG